MVQRVLVTTVPAGTGTGAEAFSPLGRRLIHAMFVLFVAVVVLAMFDSRWLLGWPAVALLEPVFLGCSFTGRRALLHKASGCVRRLCGQEASASIVIGIASAMLLAVDGIRAGATRWSDPVVTSLAALLIICLVGAIAAERHHNRLA